MRKMFGLLVFFAANAAAQATLPIQVPGESSVSVTLSAQAVPSITAFVKAVVAAGVAPTTLSGDLTSGATSISLTSTSGMTTGMGLLIDSEVMLITGANTVQRARLGTSAAAHSSGAAVVVLRSGSYSVFIANLIADVVASNMVTFPSTTIATQQAAIAAAQATIASTVASGVTHVP